MPSSNIIKLAERIAKRDAEVFEILMEFERTRKISTKTRLNFTIDKSVASKFKKFCRNKGYNMSSKIEKAMLNLLEKSK